MISSMKEQMQELEEFGVDTSKIIYAEMLKYFDKTNKARIDSQIEFMLVTFMHLFVHLCIYMYVHTVCLLLICTVCVH